MIISGLIWLNDIVEKINKKHHVRIEEVIEVLKSHPKFRYVEKGHRKGENVYSAMGQTNTGRYLMVIFIFKQNCHALILTARDMTNSERRGYENR